MMFLGVDFGGSFTKSCILEHGSNRMFYRKFITQELLHYPIHEAVMYIIRDMCKEAGKRASDVVAIGLAFAGLVDDRTGSLVFSCMLPASSSEICGAALSRHFRVPTYILNDATAAAIGEYRDRAAKDSVHLLCITLGTGIGAAYLHNGIPLTGSRGFALEVGHLPLVPGGRTCFCGKQGCLNMYASGTALRMNYFEITGVDMPPDRIWALSEFEANALEATQRFCNDLGRALVMLMHIFNPDTTVITGGVSLAGTALLTRLSQIVLQSVLPDFSKSHRLILGSLHEYAGCVGAARHAADTYLARQCEC